MADLEKKLSELLYELPQKREDVEKLQQSHNTELLTQRELRAELGSLRTEMQSLRAQLELTNNALHRSEEGYSAARDAAVCHKLNLEAATRITDAMKDQTTKLHAENMKLKSQIEDLERDLKSDMFFRESCKSKQFKIQENIKSITVQMRNLEKDYRDIERHASQAVSVSKKCQLMLEHKDKMIAQLQVRIEELSAKIRSLTSENINLQDSLKERKPTEKHYVKEILQEWQTSLQEMKTRIADSEKQSEILHQSLENALNAQSKLQKLEASANERVKEMEVRLHEANTKNNKNVTDCSAQTDGNITVDIGCQTSLQLVDCSTQTDLEPQDKNQETTMKKYYERTQFNENNQKPSFSPMTTNKMLISNSSLSDLMSIYQLERDSHTSTQDLCDLPSQANV